MEDILNNSKKKPGKSILLNYLRPIDAFDDGGTGEIRFDQNTRKIQLKSPFHKKQKKSALREHEETIKFTNILNDNSNQNTRKIRFKNPYYDEEE